MSKDIKDRAKLDEVTLLRSTLLKSVDLKLDSNDFLKELMNMKNKF